jgi:hypothetical protein
MLFFFANPEMVLRRAGERWGSFHRGIRLESRLVEPRRCELRTIGPEELETDLLFRSHAVGFAVACECAGGKDVQARYLGVEQGVGVTELTWR